MKVKEIPSVQDEDEPEMKKRHLNVVFIGHVGKLMNSTWLLYQGFFCLLFGFDTVQPVKIVVFHVYLFLFSRILEFISGVRS